MSKILFATSEAHPLIKTGGLADVSSALPIALKTLRCDIRIILPAYAEALKNIKRLKTVANIILPGLPGYVEILQGKLPNSNIKVLFVQYEPAFKRPGNPYTDAQGNPWADNAERFSLFCRAVTEVAQNRVGLNWQPDVIHCNDWQTGLVPALLSLEQTRPATLFTIHNLAYQGLFPHATFQALGLPPSLWSHNALEFHQQLSFIKGGLIFADQINTVSPRYAEEIKTAEFGYGLEGLLKHRQSALTGIVNGIDDKLWNPATDPHIHKHYDSQHLTDKSDNKDYIQAAFKLPIDKSKLLLGFIGRLVEQKGIDLILSLLTQIEQLPIQLIVLGSGDTLFETQLKTLAIKFPRQFNCKIGYDETLAHQIEAGADALLMPSRFEPCGLNQLYSLHYGTVPIVHHVGGLADTVIDANDKTLALNQATGIVFKQPTNTALLMAVNRTIALFANQHTWKKIMRNGMNSRFNWRKSALQYIKLYKTALASVAKI
ncbi:MAG: glycogen synthase GlgA [Gammaproteobacteria bacterium]|nr:glycogen synthase GlgA [Gammaproteobacteria bacterium]